MEDLNACAQCGFMTIDFDEFKDHIERHENEQQNETSENMGKTQKWNGEDLEDRSAGDRSPPEISNECTLSTSSATNVVSSKMNKIMHVCPHCNFETCMSQHMKSHLEAHERHQGQMYQCDVCHMQFSQKANMHRHRMRHSGVKPYQCRFCSKKFFRKDQMQEHSMTHIKTGVDFDCPVARCELQFSQHASLRTHLDEAHTIAPSSPAVCKRCSLMFTNSRRLLLHYQTRHHHDDNFSGMSTMGLCNRPVGQKAETRDQLEPFLSQSPILKKQRQSAQNMIYAIQEQLKYIRENCMRQNDYINKNPTRCTSTEQEVQNSYVIDYSVENHESYEMHEHSSSEDSGSSSTTEGENSQNDSLECLFCRIAFADQTMYILHKGLHAESNPWKCNLCGYQCTDVYMFNTHIICYDHSG